MLGILPLSLTCERYNSICEVADIFLKGIFPMILILISQVASLPTQSILRGEFYATKLTVVQKLTYES